jgi:hypothetical protein
MIEQHIQFIASNSIFTNIRESVIAGSLANRVKYVNNQLQVNTDKYLDKIIRNWYTMARLIQNEYPVNTITVYRTIWNIPQTTLQSKRLPHPLPFSCSFSKEFVADWSTKQNSIVLEITIPANTLCTVISNDFEQEILVEAGIVEIDYQLSENTYKCIFKSYNFLYRIK